MKPIYEQILKNLSTVPTPEYPGRILVSGASQAILITPDNEEVIIAACTHGNNQKPGKLIAFAHDAYLDWIRSSAKEMKKFSENVLKWLTGKTKLDDSEVIRTDCIEEDTDIWKYKLVIWDHLDTLSGSYEEKLLNYLANGGAIACASCPWGYLQLRPGEALKNMQLNKFLKQFGMIFTRDCLSIPSWIKTAQGQQHKIHLCNFDNALCHLEAKSVDNENNFDQCVQTLISSFQLMSCENLLNSDQKSKMNEIIRKTLTNTELEIPTESRPVCQPSAKKRMNLFSKCLNLSGQKAPGIKEFPGDYDQKPNLLQEVKLNLQTSFEETLSTGYYLPAGVELKISVHGGSVPSNLGNWVVRVGAHTDDLSSCGDSVSRWPCITIERQLTSSMTLSSPYGGLVYFARQTCDGCESIELTISNVVASPFYDLTKAETLQAWKESRGAEGLWAELAGETIIFTTPSECVRYIDDPRKVLEFWDRVVRGHHELRGTSAGNYRRERVVNDLQPSVGYMHSGYPIVTGLDCCQKEHDECLFDVDKLMEKGNWGLFHELGHNMQRDEWTFDGAIEVTVNFFSLHVYHQLIGREVHETSWLRGNFTEISKYLDPKNKKKVSYENWQQKYGVGLYTFALLIKEFGWASMYKFLSDYEVNISNSDDSLPASNQDKLDQWAIRYSNIVGCNLKKHFENFGLPVSQEVDNKIGHLKRVDIDVDPRKFFS